MLFDPSLMWGWHCFLLLSPRLPEVAIDVLTRTLLVDGIADGVPKFQPYIITEKNRDIFLAVHSFRHTCPIVLGNSISGSSSRAALLLQFELDFSDITLQLSAIKCSLMMSGVWARVSAWPKLDQKCKKNPNKIQNIDPKSNPKKSKLIQIDQKMS